MTHTIIEALETVHNALHPFHPNQERIPVGKGICDQMRDSITDIRKLLEVFDLMLSAFPSGHQPDGWDYDAIATQAEAALAAVKKEAAAQCFHLGVWPQETLEEIALGKCTGCGKEVWRWITSDIWTEV